MKQIKAKIKLSNSKKTKTKLKLTNKIHFVNKIHKYLLLWKKVKDYHMNKFININLNIIGEWNNWIKQLIFIKII